MSVPAMLHRRPPGPSASRVPGPCSPCWCVAGTLVSLVVNTARPLTNTDTYFHLRFGQEFLGGWSLRHPGSVSTFATRDWVPTQWLSEIVMARTEDWFGLAGVAWLSGLLEIALFLALYVVCRDRAEPLVPQPLTAIALFAMQNGAVDAAAGGQLPAGRGRRRRLAAHGSRRTGALVADPARVAVGDAARDVAGRRGDRRRGGRRSGPRPGARRGPGPGRRDPGRLGRRRRAHAGRPGALHARSPRSARARQYFVEWGSPDWTSWEYGALAILLVLTVLALWRRRHNAWTEILLVGLAAAFAVYSRAHGAGRGRDDRARCWPGRCRASSAVVRRSTGANASWWPVAPWPRSWPSPWPSRSRRRTRPRQAAWMDPALSALPAGTKVLDDWDQGGYFMWRYPQLDLMMHGYGDTFTTDELRRNTGSDLARPGLGGRRCAQSGARVALLRTVVEPGHGPGSCRAGGSCTSPTPSSCSGRPSRGCRTPRPSRRASAQPAEASTQRVSTPAAAPLSTASAARSRAGGRASSTAAAGRRRPRAPRRR